MITNTILKPIGNGQYTPPQSWRQQLGIDQKPIRARLEEGRIILEPLEKEKADWAIDTIQLNQLNDTTQAAIKEADSAYQKGNFKAFIDHDHFWDHVEN